MPQRFGGTHTDTKLDNLSKYLKAYSTALKNQDLVLIYFDAFAGAGGVQIGASDAALLAGVDEYSPFIKGSAERALQFGTAFDKYIFVDKNESNVRSLQTLKNNHSEIKDRISVRRGDANEELAKFCRETDWQKCRAVVFLDPYGNQVKWKTIELIAQTKAIDLWYLFPAGLGVYRQISRRGRVHDSHVSSLDELFGTRKWREVFIETQEVTDLFGTREDQKKRATVDSVTRYMIERMKQIFKGGVLDEWLPLGSKKIHMYSLLFAWANPRESAKLAGKLAQGVLRSTKRGRSK